MDNVKLNFNSDTSASYAHHRLWGSGSSVAAYRGTGQTYSFAGLVTRGQSSNFCANIVDIIDAFDTSKKKQTRVLTGGTNSSQNVIALENGLWENTSAITTITLSNFGNDFRVNSRFSIYGYKVAA